MPAFAGIDTHKDTLAVAVVDDAGRDRAAEVFTNDSPVMVPCADGWPDTAVWRASGSRGRAATGGRWRSSWIGSGCESSGCPRT